MFENNSWNLFYLGDTIAEKISGKAFLKVLSTLDEEVEVQVPILHLRPLNELFESISEVFNDKEFASVQANSQHLVDDRIHYEMHNEAKINIIDKKENKTHRDHVILNNNEDEIINENKEKTRERETQEGNKN